MREDNAGSLGLCPKPRGIGQTLTTLGCRISNAVQAEEPMTANLNHQHDDGVRGGVNRHPISHICRQSSFLFVVFTGPPNGDHFSRLRTLPQCTR